jgi:hypothetical protein
VNAFLGECPIPVGPYGFLARQVATCRFEDINFFERCQQVGLLPIWLEYLNDKFTIQNPSKMRLLKIQTFDGLGKRGGPRLQLIKLIKQPASWEGKPIVEIETDEGENLVELHHRLRQTIAWNYHGNIIDASYWLKKLGEAKNYYRHYFLAMVTRGILFESYESPSSYELEKFKYYVVNPAWNWVIKEGFPPPLIVLHPDCEPGEEEMMLNWYPISVLSELNMGGK